MDTEISDLIDPDDPNDSSSHHRRSRKKPGALWNLFTTLILLGIFVMVIYFGLIFSNPGSPLNPFPVPSLPPTVAIPAMAYTKALPSPTEQESTLVDDTQISPTEQSTTFSTITEVFPTLPLQQATPIETATLKPGVNYPYILQSKPEAISAASYNRDCNWMGVAGRIIDLQGRHATGIYVHLGGNFNGESMDFTSLSGTALDYGQSGYEFTLSQQPIASSKTLWIQLIDQSGLPLSDRFPFDTYAECEKNLILISFKQIR